MDRYRPAELASADPVTVCSACGALVADVPGHDKFHAALARKAARTAPK